MGLLSLDLLLQAQSLIFKLLAVCLFLIFLSVSLQNFIDVFNLLADEESFGLSLADFHGVESILLIKFYEGLFKLDDFLVDHLDFLLNLFLYLFVSLPRFAVALAIL